MAPVANHAKPTAEEHLANDIYCYVNYAALSKAAASRQRVMKESRNFYEKMILKAISTENKDILEYLENMYKDSTEAYIMDSFVRPFFMGKFKVPV